MLHKGLSEEDIARICAIEKRADLCIEDFRLATVPGHKAVWTLLSAAIAMIEDNHARFGPDSTEFKAAMINLARYCPLLIRWLSAKVGFQSPANWTPKWEPTLGTLANDDLRIVQNYDAFQWSYPMWYRNRTHAELIDDCAVRFTVDGGSRDKQVSAYQKGLRPSHGKYKALPGQRLDPTEAILRRYQRILTEASTTEPYGFRYEHSYELARRTYTTYTQHLKAVVRRSDNTALGSYTLCVFKQFYAALSTISAIHEYLCFCWMKWGHAYPLSSAVLVRSRESWVKLLANLARIDITATERIIGDMTFYSKRLPDLHVYPFVPLDESHTTLALVPHFVLNANAEDNILRICSYLHQSAYDLLSNDKATTMREALVQDLTRFNTHHSINLPDGSTDIDLLVEDESSSTLLLAELKWYRKPSTYRERLRADEEFLDGVHRQLQRVKEYCRTNPTFLQERMKLKRGLTDYEHVHFMLIARDHWIWVEPTDQTSVVDFEQFRSAVARHESLHTTISELLKYEWLPVEGHDFHVRFDSATVEGVRIESEVFYGGPA